MNSHKSPQAQQKDTNYFFFSFHILITKQQMIDRFYPFSNFPHKVSYKNTLKLLTKELV